MSVPVPGGAAAVDVPLHTAAVATANGSTAKVIAPGQGSYTIAMFSIEGISGDTITFEGTADGTNWYAFKCTDVTTETAATTATADGAYRGTVIGFKEVRARLTRVGGTVTVKANLVA